MRPVGRRFVIVNELAGVAQWIALKIIKISREDAGVVKMLEHSRAQVGLLLLSLCEARLGTFAIDSRKVGLTVLTIFV